MVGRSQDLGSISHGVDQFLGRRLCWVVDLDHEDLSTRREPGRGSLGSIGLHEAHGITPPQRLDRGLTWIGRLDERLASPSGASSPYCPGQQPESVLGSPIRRRQQRAIGVDDDREIYFESGEIPFSPHDHPATGLEVADVVPADHPGRLSCETRDT
jgi:hypothetical protein